MSRRCLISALVAYIIMHRALSSHACFSFTCSLFDVFRLRSLKTELCGLLGREAGSWTAKVLPTCPQVKSFEASLNAPNPFLRHIWEQLTSRSCSTHLISNFIVTSTCQFKSILEQVQLVFEVRVSEIFSVVRADLRVVLLKTFPFNYSDVVHAFRQFA